MRAPTKKDRGIPWASHTTLTGVRLSQPQRRALELLLNRDSTTSLDDIASEVGVPRSTLSSWLKDVRFANELQERVDIDLYASLGYKPRVVQLLINIAFQDMGELLNDDGTVRPVSEIPKHVRQLISEYNVDRFGAVKLKLESRTAALQVLARYFGIVRDRVEVTGANGGPVQIENSVAPIESIPRWLQMVLIAVMSGKSISERLQSEMLQEIGEYIDGEYRVIDEENEELENEETENKQLNTEFVLVSSDGFC